MLNDATCFKRVYIVCGYTDLRSGIDTLTSIVDAKTDNSPYVPDTLYLFCGRKSDRIKGLVWEKDGFLLLYKRLEQGKFIWPGMNLRYRQSPASSFVGSWKDWRSPLRRPFKRSIHPLTWHDDCAIRRIFNGDFVIANSASFIICKASMLHGKRIMQVLCNYNLYPPFHKRGIFAAPENVELKACMYRQYVELWNEWYSLFPSISAIINLSRKEIFYGDGIYRRTIE